MLGYLNLSEEKAVNKLKNMNRQESAANRLYYSLFHTTNFAESFVNKVELGAVEI